MSLLVLMGSGETAPPMVGIHREVFAQVDDGPALVLDTPFGFQENADDLTARAQSYFRDRVGRRVQAARWRRADAPTVEREAALAALRDARWAFAGPGSPTYALRHWLDTAVPEALLGIVRRGGALVLGSAAAVVAGTHAVPVYEIYKAGEEPAWATGLDLLGALTPIRAAVVPHYDNTEGGTHDTRYCYLGERRLAAMESSLPDDVGVLGVDEHTALLIDIAAGTARVEGRGAVTLRLDGASAVLSAGSKLEVAELAGRLRGEQPASVAAPDAPRAGAEVEGAHDGPRSLREEAGSLREEAGSLREEAASLREEAASHRKRFDTALEGRDVDGCVEALLDLEAAISAWSTDALQSGDGDHARGQLRAMVLRLGELTRVGARDPRPWVAPLVEALLTARQRARAGSDYATADELRDAITEAGVEVRDTPEGPQWLLEARWYRVDDPTTDAS